MAAPIQRYGDCRLYGTCLVSPCNISYEWMKTAVNPIHPKAHLINECGVRSIKIVASFIAISLTLLPLLIGKSLQIIHYHLLSSEYREAPEEAIVEGLTLPKFKECYQHNRTLYYTGPKEDLTRILRGGFQKLLSSRENGQRILLSFRDIQQLSLGSDEITVHLDLKDEEIAHIDQDDLREYIYKKEKNLSKEQFFQRFQKLFRENGYRAIRIDNENSVKKQTWMILDPSCIRILKVRSFANPDHKRLLRHQSFSQNGVIEV